ncbi:MAG: hypothetical protein H8E35_13330 [Ardenticatenia bacterium]|nr:hypothetical protein [Ardenticatenia bacterium]
MIFASRLPDVHRSAADTVHVYLVTACLLNDLRGATDCRGNGLVTVCLNDRLIALDHIARDTDLLDVYAGRRNRF